MDGEDKNKPPPVSAPRTPAIQFRRLGAVKELIRRPTVRSQPKTFEELKAQVEEQIQIEVERKLKAERAFLKKAIQEKLSRRIQDPSFVEEILKEVEEESKALEPSFGRVIDLD